MTTTMQTQQTPSSSNKRIRNRRLMFIEMILKGEKGSAVQEDLLKEFSDYFSDASLKTKAPDLFEFYIGRHIPDSEKRQPFASDMSLVERMYHNIDEREFQSMLRNLPQEAIDAMNEDIDAPETATWEPLSEVDLNTLRQGIPEALQALFGAAATKMNVQTSLEESDGEDTEEFDSDDEEAKNAAKARKLERRRLAQSRETFVKMSRAGIAQAPSLTQGSSSATSSTSQPSQQSTNNSTGSFPNVTLASATTSQNASTSFGTSQPSSTSTASASTATTTLAQTNSEPSTLPSATSIRDRSLLRDEFVRLMKERFLSGLDKEFNYSALVDSNDAFDDLDMMSRDAEDAYFDEEEEEEEVSELGAGGGGGRRRMISESDWRMGNVDTDGRMVDVADESEYDY
ncbi:hypothetical protein HDU97_008361 [Phlyctochytrium planicorne]|nr:hypothetical protein HDU97_008361 [Phlyctochytrium planicorne]